MEKNNRIDCSLISIKLSDFIIIIVIVNVFDLPFVATEVELIAMILHKIYILPSHNKQSHKQQKEISAHHHHRYTKNI